MCRDVCRAESPGHDGNASGVSNGDIKRAEAVTNGANGVSEGAVEAEGDAAIKKNRREDYDDDEEDEGDDDEEGNEDDDEEEDNDVDGDEEEEDCEYCTGRLSCRVRRTRAGSSRAFTHGFSHTETCSIRQSLKEIRVNESAVNFAHVRSFSQFVFSLTITLSQTPT